jgi:hypothetical protein
MRFALEVIPRHLRDRADVLSTTLNDELSSIDAADLRKA